MFYVLVADGVEFMRARYKPGDVAVIHAEALPSDVEAFLSCIGYANVADDPVTIHRVLDGRYAEGMIGSMLIALTSQTNLFPTTFRRQRPFARYSLATWTLTPFHDAHSLSS